ncbi:MAG: protein translocase subunit SecD [Holosporaceae bacterium]|jgi:preprotein translocase subunit SecD|nr:protein translocase subunit SecD [Holosporaceae bacterium]
MNFPKWKEMLVIFICALGLVFALPNILPQRFLNMFPSWLPDQKVNLGLDLRGGAHILLEVDLISVRADYLNQVLDAARNALRKEAIPYAPNFPKAIAREQEQVEFDLKDSTKIGKAKIVLGMIDPDFKVEITGTHVTLTPMPGILQRRESDAVDRSIEIVRKRVDETGTREASIQRQGNDRILLQIPGLQDPSHVKALLGRTAKMTFRLVDENAPEVMDRKKAVAPVGSIYFESPESGKFIAVKKHILVGGETLTDAGLGYDEYNRPEVSFKFNKIGAKKFGEATRENVGKRFAIILDNEIISAPVIQTPITGGSGRITGDFSLEKARDLALLLRAGALPAPLTVIEEKTVGPDLGADSIHSGIMATLLSGLFVLVFMFLWYSSFGLIADIAVMANLILLIAGLSCLQATLTLPGIAGIALTVGMAVDANVLINERIKEYIRKGEKWMKAVEAGYDLAMTSIVDTNLNTIIGMMCLYQFGTGPVKGFAITTILGTIISFFTSTTLTRYVVTILMKLKYRISIPM